MKKLICLASILVFLNANGQSIAERELYRGSVPNSTDAPNKENTTIGDDKMMRIGNVIVPSITMHKPAQQSFPLPETGNRQHLNRRSYE